MSGIALWPLETSTNPNQNHVEHAIVRAVCEIVGVSDLTEIHKVLHGESPP